MHCYSLTIWGKIGFYAAVVMVLLVSISVTTINFFSFRHVSYFFAAELIIQYTLLTLFSFYVLTIPVYICVNEQDKVIVFKSILKTLKISIDEIDSILRLPGTKLPSYTQDHITIYCNKKRVVLVFTFADIDQMIKQICAINIHVDMSRFTQ